MARRWALRVRLRRLRVAPYNTTSGLGRTAQDFAHIRCHYVDIRLRYMSDALIGPRVLSDRHIFSANRKIYVTYYKTSVFSRVDVWSRRRARGRILDRRETRGQRLRSEGKVPLPGGIEWGLFTPVLVLLAVGSHARPIAPPCSGARGTGRTAHWAPARAHAARSPRERSPSVGIPALHIVPWQQR